MRGSTPTGTAKWGRDARHPFLTSSVPVNRIAPISRSLPSSMGRLPWTTSDVSMAYGGPSLQALNPAASKVNITSNSTEGAAKIHQDFVVLPTESQYTWEKFLAVGDHVFTLTTHGGSAYTRRDAEQLAMLTGDPAMVGRRIMSGRLYPILTAAMLNILMQEHMEHIVACLQNPTEMLYKYANYGVQTDHMEALRDFWPSDGLMADVLSPFHERDWRMELQQPGVLERSPWRNLVRPGSPGPATALVAALKLCNSPPFCYAWPCTIMRRVKYLGVIASVPPVANTSDRVTGAVMVTVCVQGRAELSRNTFLLPDGVWRGNRFKSSFMPVSSLVGFRLLKDSGISPASRPNRSRAFQLHGYVCGGTPFLSQHELSYEYNHPLAGIVNGSARLNEAGAMDAFREYVLSHTFYVGRLMTLPSRKKIPNREIWMRAMGLHPDTTMDPKIMLSSAIKLGDAVINIGGRM